MGPVLTGVHRVGGGALRIGRDPSNDLVINDLLVSRRHAEFHAEPRLRDRRPRQRQRHLRQRPAVSRAGPAPEGDIVGIGRHQLRLAGAELLEYEDTGDLTFVASELTVTVPAGAARRCS